MRELRATIEAEAEADSRLAGGLARQAQQDRQFSGVEVLVDAQRHQGNTVYN